MILNISKNRKWVLSSINKIVFKVYRGANSIFALIMKIFDHLEFCHVVMCVSMTTYNNQAPPKLILINYHVRFLNIYTFP